MTRIPSISGRFASKLAFLNQYKLPIIGAVAPIADILELAELLLRLNGRDDVDAILDRLEAGELTVREAVDALRRRLQ